LSILKVLGIGDLIVTDNTKEVIKTFSLGSCVAAILYHPGEPVLGMTHIVLPESQINPGHSLEAPGFFADTALNLLLDEMKAKYRCNLQRIKATLVGGASMTKERRDYFNIGFRNVNAIRDILQQNNISEIDSTQTGGYYSRTVEVAVSDGSIRISTFPLRFR
jgi:chemotaxis protein CheD